jgi:hypothetical protein
MTVEMQLNSILTLEVKNPPRTQSGAGSTNDQTMNQNQ